MSWIIQQNPAHTVSNLNTAAPKAFLSSLTFNVFALMHLSQDPMMFKVNIPPWSYFCLSMCWFIRKSVFRTFQPLCVYSLFLFFSHINFCGCPQVLHASAPLFLPFVFAYCVLNVCNYCLSTFTSSEWSVNYILLCPSSADIFTSVLTALHLTVFKNNFCLYIDSL